MSQDEPVPIDLLTKAETAQMLRVSLKTLTRWGHAGTLTPIKIGKTVRYRAADVRALIGQQDGAA